LFLHLLEEGSRTILLEGRKPGVGTNLQVKIGRALRRKMRLLSRWFLPLNILLNLYHVLIDAFAVQWAEGDRSLHTLMRNYRLEASGGVGSVLERVLHLLLRPQVGWSNVGVHELKIVR
jgi:hypothetical protein